MSTVRMSLVLGFAPTALAAALLWPQPEITENERLGVS